MKKTNTLFLVTAFLMASFSNAQQNMNVTYPKTTKVTTVDTYFGTEVKDPYRWLEDDRSTETEAWVKEQNKVTFGYLNDIPYRETLEKRLKKLWDYEKVYNPFKEGDYIYFYKNDGLQDHEVLYRKKENQREEIFIDPNTFAKDGTTSLAGTSFTKDGSLVTCSISEGGSDWRKAIVLSTATKEIVEDTLVDIKFGRISWKGNDGFYYSSYDKPKGSELSAKTDQHKLYYHKLGTLQTEDLIIYGGTPEEKHRYISGTVTEDEKYLLVSASISTSGNKLFIKDLSNPMSEFHVILDHTDTDSYVIDNVGSKLYIVTNMNAPNKKIVTVDAANPVSENWVDFIPETDKVLIPNIGGGYFFTEYMVDAISKVFQYSYEGKLVREVKLPGIGTVYSFKGKKKSYISTIPITIHHCHPINTI